MYEKQEHYLPITIWYLQHVIRSCNLAKKRMICVLKLIRLKIASKYWKKQLIN